MSLDAIVRRGARTIPDATAIVDPHVSWTWAELDRQVTRCADALRTLGLGPGSRLAAADYNSAAYFALLYGAARLGAVLCPLNYLSSQDELRYLLGDFEPHAVLAGPEFHDRLVEAAAHAAARACRCSRSARPATSGTPAWPPPTPTPRSRASDPDALHLVMYTSGTTGRPKGVAHTQRAHYLDGFFTSLACRIRSTDSFVVHAPSFHAASWDHAKIFLVADGSIVVLPRFDPLALMEAYTEHRATVLQGVPAVLRALLSHPRRDEFDLSSVRAVLAGGSLDAAALQRQFAESHRPRGRLLPRLRADRGRAVRERAPARARGDASPRSIGRPLPGVEMELVDPDSGAFVEDGGMGEIVVRAPTIMAAYWRNPEASAAALRDGWLHTGDLGVRDPDGDYAIVDRLKDMIRSGGENVYAAEVERVLLIHPGDGRGRGRGVAGPALGRARGGGGGRAPRRRPRPRGAPRALPRLARRLQGPEAGRDRGGLPPHRPRQDREARAAPPAGRRAAPT